MQKLNCRDAKGTPKLARKQWRKAAFRTANLTTYESESVEARRVFKLILDRLISTRAPSSQYQLENPS